MGLGFRIYNYGVKKRNEYIENRRIKKAIDQQIKVEAKQEYWDQYEASRREEVVDKATTAAYHRAHGSSGWREKASAGISYLSKVGSNVVKDVSSDGSFGLFREPRSNRRLVKRTIRKYKVHRKKPKRRRQTDPFLF